MKAQTLMAKDFINTYLNGRYEEGKDESTDVIVNMISTLERERNEARREVEALKKELAETDEALSHLENHRFFS